MTTRVSLTVGKQTAGHDALIDPVCCYVDLVCLATIADSGEVFTHIVKEKSNAYLTEALM